jgi:preprotein translocase subunit Sec61beta
VITISLVTLPSRAWRLDGADAAAGQPLGFGLRAGWEKLQHNPWSAHDGDRDEPFARPGLTSDFSQAARDGGRIGVRSVGALAMIVSAGLLKTAMWARVTGVAIAGLVIIANFLSLPYYPVWSVVMITISGFVIWALCVVQPGGNLYDLSGERQAR